MKAPNLGTQGLVGLAAGLAAGAAIGASHAPVVTAAGGAIEAGGKLWINAILMTIIPLVFSKLFVAIAGNEDARAVGRMGTRAVVLFLILLFTTALAAAVVMPFIFGSMRIDGDASAALRAKVASHQTPAPEVSESLLAIVPSNVVRAAADGAIVPLLVFAIAFALAATRIADAHRMMLLQFFQAVDSAISILLGWIVRISPYGIFALAVGLAMSVGVGIVNALGYYIVISAVVLVAFTLVLYAVVALATNVSIREFAAAAAPSQIVAVSTHSSTASLPAMIDGANRLGLPRSSTGFVLPLSLAVFKYSGPVWFVTAACFVARLYDIPIDPSRVIPMVLISIATSFAIGGVPSGAAVLIAPVLLSAGLPVEATALLLAVDSLPNAFRTAANVTGMLAVTVLCGARERHPVPVQILDMEAP